MGKVKGHQGGCTQQITNSKKNNNIKIKIKMLQQLNLRLLFSVTNSF
jgi:hypothetical protein